MKLSSADNHSHLILVVTFWVVSASLFEPLLGWIHILVASSAIMRIALYLKLHKHAPSIRTLNLLALLSGIVLAYFSLQLGVLLGMVNLLVMACALKLMLLRNAKDYYQLITSVGFIIGCGFIFQQGIGFSLFYLTAILALLISVSLHISPSLGVKPNIRHIAILSLQAAPITLILFFVLPKIGPLWQMPASKTTQTGLTEKVTPGDIANLSQSSELAFRVSFESNNMPTMPQRYWRAMVLENFDGHSWQVDKQRKQIRKQYQAYQKEFAPNVSGPAFRYEVLAEPTHQRWLYALDLAQPEGISSNQKIWQSQEYQLISINPVVSRFQYKVASYPETTLNQTLFSVDSRINLQVPEQGNPKTQQWVQSMREKYPDDKELIEAIMAFFAENEFSYTLQPPLMPDDPIDTFLFDSRQGFCSHYASAMAYTLRLAGIPARLVTGYQGGELNQSGFMSVYQYDAHAWVEAWYDQSGWQKFDPTAMVAPERINLGLRGAIPDQAFLLDSPFSLTRLRDIAWLNALRLVLADIDYNWSKWVVGFDTDKQQDLFKSLLGSLSVEKIALFTTLCLLSIGILVAMYFLPDWHRNRPDKVSRYYQQATALLAKHQLNRAKQSGPQAYAEQVAKTFNAPIAESFFALTADFIQHRYEQHHTDSKARSQRMSIKLKQLKRQLAQFKNT